MVGLCEGWTWHASVLVSEADETDACLSALDMACCLCTHLNHVPLHSFEGFVRVGHGMLPCARVHTLSPRSVRVGDGMVPSALPCPNMADKHGLMLTVAQLASLPCFSVSWHACLAMLLRLLGCLPSFKTREREREMSSWHGWHASLCASHEYLLRRARMLGLSASASASALHVSVDNKMLRVADASTTSPEQRSRACAQTNDKTFPDPQDNTYRETQELSEL